MYNDYYLEQINNKLGNISTQLNELTIDNNENFKTLHSGDILLQDSLDKFEINVSFILIWVNICLFAILFYHFYASCFKGR